MNLSNRVWAGRVSARPGRAAAGHQADLPPPSLLPKPARQRRGTGPRAFGPSPAPGVATTATLGGEVSQATYTGFRRSGRFGRTPLPGGEGAARRPARMALGYLYGGPASVRTAMGRETVMRSQAELSAEDVLNLTVETAGTPVNVAAVAVLDGDTLLDGAGRLRTAEIRSFVASRLPAVPRLRQTPVLPGLFGGRPRWRNVTRFRIEDHVQIAEFTEPGGEDALLSLAARLIARPFARSQPLWRLWLVPGLPGRRVGVVFLLHHVVADGMASIQMITSLLGATPQPMAAPPSRPLTPPPGERRGHAADGLLILARSWWAPRSSLNALVGTRRRVVCLHLDLAAAKAIAHRHGGTVNDVVLALAAGGVRALLHGRGDPLAALHVTTSVAVSLRTPGMAPETGNRTGGFLVRLPIAEPGAAERLRHLAISTAEAKRSQSVTAGNRILVALARLGVVRWLSRHQRATQVMESNMVGPPAPVTMLGAPVLDVVAVGSLVGNVALSVVTLSYAGRLNITVHADAAAFPDLPVLLAGIRHDWAVLAADIST
jgi:diacylglycerol O-acyltransferase